MPKNNKGITSRSAGANVRARTQQRHKNLLSGRGIDPKSNVGTPKPKRKNVQSVQTQAIKNRAPKKTSSYGPQPKLAADSSGTKNLGVKKPNVGKVSAIKSKGSINTKPTSSAKISKPEETSYQDQLASRKKNRKLRKAKGVMDKADQAAKSGKLKKAARLEKRSIRKAERAAGKRKTTAGTILKGAGLGLGRGLARLGGYGGKFKGKASDKKQK